MLVFSTAGILRNLSFENDACRAEIAAQKGIEALLEVRSDLFRRGVQGISP